MKPAYTYLFAALATPFLAWGMAVLLQSLLNHYSFGYYDFSWTAFIAAACVSNLLIVFITQPKLLLWDFGKKWFVSLIFTAIATFTLLGIFIVYILLCGDFVGC